jgi:zinc/manganese transport system ATP-binding protein
VTSPAPLALTGASLAYGPRTVWSGVDLTVAPGEFLTVLGPNGSGKTSLLRVVLGLTPLTGGRLTIAGAPARRGSRDVGYIPQQRLVDPATPVRARDLVRLGLDGDRWGIG